MKKLYFLFIFISSFFFCLPSLQAQSDSQIKLTITPPMIKNNVIPGQIWRSSVKLVNNNSSEIDIYVRLNDFKGGKEDGTVEFLPELAEGEAGNEAFLSQWIEIEKGPIKVPAYKSVDIEFAIRVPETAEPGGHYAAILAGTQPDSEGVQGSMMKVSSLLASLILLNVQGEVEEKGLIREFSTGKKYYGNEDVDFTVRFQNSGNVHIQPQGEIRIYNMWGKDKGAIAINQGSAFGNVLPDDIRKWNFSWRPENSLLEMGRHKAVLILGYGNQARQTVDQTMFFWVIFVKPLLIVLGSIVFLVSFLVLSIRYYIRRAIIMTQREAGIVPPTLESASERHKVIPNSTVVLNLKSEAASSADEDEENDEQGVKWGFFKNYSRAIIIVLLIVLTGLSYVYYQRNYGYKKSPADQPLTEEDKRPEAAEIPQTAVEIIEEEKAASSSPADEIKVDTSASKATTSVEAAPSIDNDAFFLRIANGSGLVGAASDVDKILYASGYKADKLDNADNFNYQITLVKYLEKFEAEAQAISRIIGVKVEMQPVEKQAEDILVVVGKNIRKN